MIGETLYTFDRNRRVYITNGEGQRVIDTDKMWRAHTVTGETRDSWILGEPEGYKVNKKTMELRLREFYGMDRRAYTAAEKEDKVWRDKHARQIIHLVERADITTLRKIAGLLGVH